MILLVFTELWKTTEVRKYPLLKRFHIVRLDENLSEIERHFVSGADHALQGDEQIFQYWTDALLHIAGLIEDEQDRIFIFASDSNMKMFHTMKNKCKVKLRTTHNGSLESLVDCSELPGSDVIDEILQVLNAYDLHNFTESGLIKESKKNSGLCGRNNIISCDAYKYIGDTTTKVFHKKDSRCIDKIDTANLQGLGKQAKHQGWVSCPVCVSVKKASVHRPAPKKKQISYDQYIGHIAARSKKTKAQIIEEQIALLCEEYGMHAAFRGGTAFITTIAGEWFFTYNDRPIKLRHRNYSAKYAEQGKSYDHYHLQSRVFPSPLFVIEYIREHEIQLKRKLMERLDVEDYMLGFVKAR